MKRDKIIYTDAETFTPEEEITAENSTFATAGTDSKKQIKSSAKRTLTIVIALLVCTAILVGGYFIFLYEPPVEAEVDSFYLLSAEGKDALEDIKGVISFKDTEEELAADKLGKELLTFVLQLKKATSVKVKFDEGTKYVTLSSEGKEISYTKDVFFRVFEDGTPYAFDGENLIVNGFLELNGEEKISLSMRAFSGYDTDGDTCTSTGKPFMYPSITRSDVQSITVKNSEHAFEIYRFEEGSGTFYIKGAEGVDLNAEAFSYLVVNSTYTCAEGKLSNPKDFSQYGLEGDGSTAKITVKTLKGETHTLIIGDTDASGGYNYARYEGKEHVYLLLASDVESTFAAGGEKYLTANLVYPIEDTNDIYGIDKMAIYYRDLDETLTIRLRRPVASSSNIVLSDEDADAATLLTDLKRAGGKYTDWTQNSAFIGMGSKNEKAIQLAFSLNRTSADGNYSIKLPLVRHEEKGAYLPEKVTVRIYTDGESFDTVEYTGGETLATQKNGTYYTHVLSFKSDKPVQYVRIDLEGYSEKKLFVTDEIRIMSGETDANPADAFIGTWMITTDKYIPENRNYGYVNTTNYVEYLMSLCVLVGDEVVKFGIEEMDLVEYGLSKGEDGKGTDPAIQIHYEYKDYTMDLLISDPQEDGSRYVASMITSFDGDGEEVKFLNPYIARLTTETAPWLEWEPLDFVSTSVLYMYIDNIDELKFTYDGNEHNFIFGKDETGILNSATIGGKEVDLDQFRKLYLAVINIYRNGTYDGEEKGSEMLRLNLVSETKTDEIIFYRVSNTKAYYTIDGAGGYYTLTYEVSELIDKLEALLAGEKID